MTIRRIAALGTVGAAVAAALAPFPPAIVERWYSEGWYPHVQRALTRASNVVPISLFDGLCLAAFVWFVWMVARTVRRHGVRGLPGAGWRVLVTAAAIYLLFLVTWGLNYRRVPLERRLAYDPSLTTAAATLSLAQTSAREMNRLYEAAHAGSQPGALREAFFEAQRALGAPALIVPGRPKPTLLGWYFQRAAIAGMTDPFFLEVMLAPDLLDVEEPFVLAHEWGHLAGFADESEANFIGWLACMRGDARARYSGWLAVFGHALAAVPGRERAGILRTLDGGPRSDLAKIAERYASSSAVVRFAARETYDRYLKANRVAEGIESYDAVLELILGTSLGRSTAAAPSR